MIPRIDASHERQDVTVRCQDNASVSVRFSDPERSDDRCVSYAIEVRAAGLSARLDDAVAWIGGAGELAPFLEELAEDFAGWEGERHWETNDHDLSVAAVFRSGGYVGMTWTLRPWRRADGGWSASVTTHLEAGEQMASFAADLRPFLEGHLG
ncbi:DUF6228 family protein [Streptomyces sp. NPDC091268]|uniref:DUF6228 family protein n=1 Tax=Streptomyces sp. NPDC091268 TaxID=3365979 RepID=UPI003811C347